MDVWTAAARGTADDMVQALARQPEALNAVDAHGRTAAHAAALHRNLPALRVLMAAPGLDLAVRDREGCVPVHMAASRAPTGADALFDDPATLKVLVEEGGADATTATPDGLTAVHFAAAYCLPSVVSYLSSRPDCVSALRATAGVGSGASQHDVLSRVQWMGMQLWGHASRPSPGPLAVAMGGGVAPPGSCAATSRPEDGATALEPGSAMAAEAAEAGTTADEVAALHADVETVLRQGPLPRTFWCVCGLFRSAGCVCGGGGGRSAACAWPGKGWLWLGARRPCAPVHSGVGSVRVCTCVRASTHACVHCVHSCVHACLRACTIIERMCSSRPLQRPVARLGDRGKVRWAHRHCPPRCVTPEHPLHGRSCATPLVPRTCGVRLGAWGVGKGGWGGGRQRP
jgi:hypothetical protein